MFKIEDWDGPNFGFMKKIVIDRDRDVSVQAVDIRCRVNIRLFRLSLKNKIIPFEAAWDPGGVVEGTGKYILLYKIMTIGTSWFAQEFRPELKEYVFDNEAEKQEAKLLAIESLFTYGDCYDGPTNPREIVKVIDGEKTYVLSDFQ